jgi:pimeloyl-ACP methyl ester carboxylesterase
LTNASTLHTTQNNIAPVNEETHKTIALSWQEKQAMLTGEIDGYLTYYDVDDFTDPWKEPATVLLYHGLGRSVDVWYRWVPVLARHYRVLRTDCRGHGRSDPPRQGYQWSLATLAREAKLLLDRLAIRRVHWAGESLGGLIGIQFANDYPDRLASLTLCSTPYRYNAPAQDQYRKWSQHLQRMSVKEWYLQGTELRFDPSKDDQQMIQWFADLVGQTDAGVVRAVLRFLPDVDVSALCTRITVPTLIIHPGQSLAVPLEDAQAMHQAIPGSRLVEYKSARHNVFITHGEECAQEMLRFLRSLA